MKKFYVVQLSLVILAALLGCIKANDDSFALKDNIGVEEAGDGRAQYEQGRKYYWGQGVPQDCREALKWFRKSAEQGSSEAQYVLGAMYYLGDGVGQDYVLAHRWFALAAEQGNDKAREIMGVMTRKMTPAQIQEARKAADDP